MKHNEVNRELSTMINLLLETKDDTLIGSIIATLSELVSDISHGIQPPAPKGTDGNWAFAQISLLCVRARAEHIREARAAREAEAQPDNEQAMSSVEAAAKEMLAKVMGAKS